MWWSLPSSLVTTGGAPFGFITKFDTQNIRMLPGGGKVYTVEFLCHKFFSKILVRNLFGVFQDLHGCTLGCAFAHLYHAKGFGE